MKKLLIAVLLGLPTYLHASGIFNPGSGSGGGGGGASTLEVYVGATRSSPTATIGFDASDFDGAVTGSSITVSIDGTNSTKFIHNQTTPQSATFNVSSGTASSFNAVNSTISFIDGFSLTMSTAYIRQVNVSTWTLPVSTADDLRIGTGSNRVAFVNPAGTAVGVIQKQNNGDFAITNAQTTTNLTLRTNSATRLTVQPGGLSLFAGTVDMASSATVKGAGGLGVTYEITAGSATIAGQRVCLADGTNCPVAATGVTVYPASATASFPYGLSASTISVSTITLTGFPTDIPLYVDGSGAINARAIRLDADVTNTLPEASGGTGETLFDDGEILIGNGATGGLDKTTLTAGSNITITNGEGSITIAASASGSGDAVLAATQTWTGGNVYQGYSTFLGTASLNGIDFCLEDGTNCPATSGGGLSTLEVLAGVNRTSPTVTIGFPPTQFVGSVSGSSMTVTLNTSSVTLQGNTIGGDVTGTLGALVVGDDSHAHTTTSISGLDISADTNLTASGNAILSGDNIDVGPISLSTGVMGSLPAASVAAGTLGASVVASSITNASVVAYETALEGVMDLQDMQGAVTAGQLPADGYASTYVNVTGDTMTGQLTNTSSVTVGGAGLIASFATVSGTMTVSGQSVCLANGTNCPAPGGAASTLEAFIGTARSSPTASITANTSQFVGSVTGSTFTFTLNTSSVSALGPAIDGGTAGDITDDSITAADLAADSVGQSELLESMNFVPTGTWDFGGAAGLEVPNGSNPTVDATGECALDTTDNALVCYDGANAQVVAHSTHSFTVTISSEGWNGHSMVVWRAPHDMAVTINKIMAESLTASTTVMFQLDETTFGGTASAGTDVFSVAFSSAHNQGVTTTSFTNPGIAAQSSLVFNTPAAGAAGGAPKGVTFTVYYTKDRE